MQVSHKLRNINLDITQMFLKRFYLLMLVILKMYSVEKPIKRPQMDSQSIATPPFTE